MPTSVFPMIFTALCALLVLPTVFVYILRSFYRAYWAPLVRKALNTAYQTVESIAINLDEEKTNAETVYRLEWAFASFRDARRALDSGNYKRCIELADQATSMARTNAPRAVLKMPLRPTPPSMRIISKPDCLVWMG
jgi:hypothetical protein